MPKIPDFRFDDHSSLPFKMVKLKAPGKDYVFKAHRHNYFELFVFEKGGGRHLIDRDSYPVKSKSVHCVPPGAVHLLRHKAGVKGFVLLFSRRFMSINYSGFETSTSQHSWISEIWSKSKTLNFSEVQFKGLMELVQMTWKWYDRDFDGSDGKQQFFKHLSSLIFIQINQVWRSKPTENKILRIDERAQQFLVLLNKHLLRETSVSQYAEKLFCSVDTLDRCCRRHFGKSAAGVIRERRLLEASRLMVNSEVPIQEIGFHLGFADASSFTKFIKRETGESPVDYKVSLRKKYK